MKKSKGFRKYIRRLKQQIRKTKWLNTHSLNQELNEKLKEALKKPEMQ